MSLPGIDHLVDCAECAEAFENPKIQSAAYGAACDLAAGKISYAGLQEWLWYLVHMPVILCPYCGDWEDIDDCRQIEATGRFWCCTMCELAGRGPA